jgi:RNA polymerase sigma factor (sigma-70 family)
MEPRPLDPLIRSGASRGAALDVSQDPPDVSEPSPDESVVESTGATVSDDVRVVETIEVVYSRLYTPLARLAYLLVDTRELAEEAVQEAFAKAYPRWRRIEQPEAYLRTSVVNACRKVQRRRELVRRTPLVAVADAPAAGDLADHVADVVRALPPTMREAVVLRYYLQLTDAEIARTLDIAVGTVKSTLNRARHQLRRQLS